MEEAEAATPRTWRCSSCRKAPATLEATWTTEDGRCGIRKRFCGACLAEFPGDPPDELSTPTDRKRTFVNPTESEIAMRAMRKRKKTRGEVADEKRLRKEASLRILAESPSAHALGWA